MNCEPKKIINTLKNATAFALLGSIIAGLLFYKNANIDEYRIAFAFTSIFIAKLFKLF